MFFPRRVALTLLAVLFVFAVPAGASAAVYQVDSTGDEPDAAVGVAGCLTAGLKCTLRAAIQESDASTGIRDEITFSSAFDRQLSDTIDPATPLPAIEDPVSILGGDCFGEDGPDAPCAGVKGPSGAAALTVEDTDGVVIEGLSVTGAQFGIDVIDGSQGFVAKNDWIGLNLIAEDAGNGTGIFLDPGSDGAQIGGSQAGERNVISGNEFDGLDLQGASDAVIRGNYFGVNPAGPVGLPGGDQAIANAKDIEITDSTAGGGIKAENNEIGETIEGAAATSVPCDGGCNVISSATSSGIDLNGDGAGQLEAPASGPTLLHGNFIGLDAAGTGTVANVGWGILAGSADEVTVGGFPLGDANYLSGGSEGIVSEEGESFIARGNRLGVGPDGADLTQPGKGIFALDQGVSQAASIEQNLVRAGGVGIEQRGSLGHVTGNEVVGGSVGIWALGEPGGGLIASNTIEGPGEYGVLVEGPDNEVRDNTIVNSGGAGIRVKNPPGVAMTGVLIGGSSPERENVIEKSSGPAIEIVEAALEPGSTTEITRNRGSSNSGLFIDLVAGANEGIAPPVVATPLQSSASGTAVPGAVIRVFRKGSAEVGELQGFLAETEADGSGNWKATFPAVAAGTLLTATQTNESSATSELAAPVAAASESGGGGGGGNNNGGASGGGNNGGGGSSDKTPPDTKIVKGPPKKTHKTTVKFKFTATEAGSSFQCKLDKKPFKPCGSPKTYKKLKPAKHVFEVRAIDKAGHVDPTPAKRKFTVLK
jgi:CSLREA domain-containing protein